MTLQIVLYINTTGFSVRSGDRIIELGCVELVGGKRTGNNLHFYFNPGRDSHEDALKVHGISNDFLRDKPKFAEVADEILRYLQDAELVVYSAYLSGGAMLCSYRSYPVCFLDKELKLLGKPPLAEHVEKNISIYNMAEMLYPDERNSLDMLCDRLDVDNSVRTPDDALLYAELLADVYLKLVSAFARLHEAAEQGDAEVQIKLGMYYAESQDDAQQAAMWFRKAAEQGHAEAPFKLGKMMACKVKDDVQAEMWFRKAAEQGHAHAQEWLGRMYYGHGWGIAQDPVQAAAWYRKAAKQGRWRAQVRLGDMYKDGLGVAQDPAEAVAWYRKAAERGHAEAQFSLGTMYERGQGVAQDPAQAVAWYRKAAKRVGDEWLFDERAQYELGLMYRQGRGVARNDAKAAKLFRKLAEREGPCTSDAQYELGRMYRQGQGVVRSDAKAAAWLRKAAENGHDEARRELDAMHELDAMCTEGRTK